ncbi:MAG: hypothetical protein EHM67_14600 [Hyphomicrobiaceae bacterium]|nr:MAG: hypothetical protein EHM67_14600 [Hyphomicrobiaceae bacterium]
MNFVINIVALLAAGGIFFVSIDRVAPDAFFSKIAKIAIGAMLLIALILVVAAVFGMGGGIAISPLGVVWFAVAVIIAVVVLYIINLVIDWIAANMGGGPWVTPVKYVLGAIVLIGLLLAAANLLFGYHIGPGLRGEIPFPAAAAALA